MQERHQTFPNAPEAFFLVIAAFIVEMLVAGLLGSTLALGDIALGALARLLTYALLFGVLLEWKGIGYASLFHPSSLPLRPYTTSLLLPVLLLTPGLVIVAGVLLNVLDTQLELPAPAELTAMLNNLDFATIVTICLLAPVLEEMLFRGVILRSFLRQYERRSAILGSAVIFGFAHLNSLQFVAAFGIGLLLGWLYERSRSLLPCILLHFAYNTGTVLLVENADIDLSPLAMLGWAAVSGAAMVYLVRRLAVSAAG